MDYDKIIGDNLGLVWSCLHKYHLATDAEAQSIAYEALWKAVENFDKERNYKLSTVATVYIRNALGSYIRTMKKQRQLEIISYNSIAYLEDGTSHEFLEFFSTSNTPEDIVILNEEIDVLRRAIVLEQSMLSGNRKCIVDIWIESEYTATNSSIAEEVGVSQPYVNMILSRFRRAVIERMEEMYSD